MNRDYIVIDYKAVAESRQRRIEELERALKFIKESGAWYDKDANQFFGFNFPAESWNENAPEEVLATMRSL